MSQSNVTNQSIDLPTNDSFPRNDSPTVIDARRYESNRAEKQYDYLYKSTRDQEKQIDYLYKSTRDQEKSFWDKASSSDKFLMLAVIVVFFVLGFAQAFLFVAGYYIQNRVRKALLSAVSNSSSIENSVSNARRTLNTNSTAMDQRITAQTSRMNQNLVTTTTQLDNTVSRFQSDAVADINRTNFHIQRHVDQFTSQRVFGTSTTGNIGQVSQGIKTFIGGAFSFIINAAPVIIPGAVVDGIVNSIER